MYTLCLWTALNLSFSLCSFRLPTSMFVHSIAFMKRDRNSPLPKGRESVGLSRWLDGLSLLLHCGSRCEEPHRIRTDHHQLCAQRRPGWHRLRVSLSHLLSHTPPEAQLNHPIQLGIPRHAGYRLQHHRPRRHIQLPPLPPTTPRPPNRTHAHAHRRDLCLPLGRRRRLMALRCLWLRQGLRLDRHHELRSLGLLVRNRRPERYPRRLMRRRGEPAGQCSERHRAVDCRWLPEQDRARCPRIWPLLLR